MEKIVNIPFLKDKTVLLLEDPARMVPVSAHYWEAVKRRLEHRGYRFIVLPELLMGLNPVVTDYLFPGYEVPGASDLYRQIADLAGVSGRSGLLFRKGRYTYFQEISLPDVDGAVSSLLSQLRERVRPRFRNADSGVDILGSFITRQSLELYDGEADACLEAPAPCIPIDEDLDPRTRYILEEVERLLRENNLTLDELKVIIGYKVKLSRLQITRKGKIFLTDFVDPETGQPKEVKMDSLTKMLYFFFLRHPEGVRIKEVGDYMAELMHLYMGITGRDDREAIRASILGHVDPFGNSINVSMSRIKAAFKNQMDAAVARYYWVEGKGGEPYRVAIDRDYVLWEYGD